MRNSELIIFYCYSCDRYQSQIPTPPKMVKVDGVDVAQIEATVPRCIRCEAPMKYSHREEVGKDL